MHIQRQRDTFSWRFAAVNQDLVDNLNKEFHDWRKQQPKGSIFGGGMIGGLDHWPNIESFLKDNYPAAHKGLDMGYENARPLLDSDEDWMEWDDDERAWLPGPTLYETGPEAMAQYGYDPKEIAAGMLLLHNKTDRFRGDMSQEDQQRLVDIFNKRQQMQREYEKRQNTAARNPHEIMGVNINDKHQDFTGQILRGEKTIETRDSHSLHPYVGRRIGLVSTGRGPATLVGFATVGEPIRYETREDFDADYDRHLVEPGSQFDFKDGVGKFGYPFFDVEPVEPWVLPKVNRGNISRSLDREASYHTAMPTYYHHTRDPNFAIDPDRKPDNAVLNRDLPYGGKGLWVSPDKDHWRNYNYQGRRPYLVELYSEEDLGDHPSELFVGGDRLKNLQVKSVERKSHHTATYYHVTHRDNEDSIRQHGLDYTKGNPQWGETNGNYFWENEEDAYDYADKMTQFEQDDAGLMNEVPGYIVMPFEYHGPKQVDPEGQWDDRGKSFYTTNPIPPEAFRHAHRTAGANGDLPPGMTITRKEYPRTNESSWHAYHDGQEIGSLWVMPSDYSDKGAIADVTVHDDYLRRGVATALWNAAGRPAHTPGKQSGPGEAWALSVGGDQDLSNLEDEDEDDDSWF